MCKNRLFSHMSLHILFFYTYFMDNFCTYKINAYICNVIKPFSMNAKLTLTIEQSVIDRAKQYARQKRYSLSGIIENYLKSLAKEVIHGDEIVLSPTVKMLKGSFHAPSEFDYKNELISGLTDKYMTL